MHKIGITERADASINTSWVEKLKDVDGAILITKHLTIPFMDIVCEHKDKVIVHVSVTGYSGSKIEPNTPDVDTIFENVKALYNRGFPREQIVIRCDPIIPTEKGIAKATKIIRKFVEYGMPRYRISLIRMGNHVGERFNAKHLPSPYGTMYIPSPDQYKAVDQMVVAFKAYWNYLWSKNPLYPLRIEACSEPCLREVIHCGCVSEYDLHLLGLEVESTEEPPKKKLPGCMCYPGKVELISYKPPCENKCLYCDYR